LVDESTALLPPAIGLICRGEGGIEELGARLEGFDMPRVW